MRSPAGRIAIVVGTAAILVVLFVVLRSSNDDEAAPTTTATTTTQQATTTATTGATTTAATTAATTTVPEPPGPERIRVTVTGGKVRAPRGVTLKKGARVVLVVRADVSDHVHVHGYDLMRNVGPGAPAQIAFRATIVGRFEVELEDRKLQILEFEVRP